MVSWFFRMLHAARTDEASFAFLLFSVFLVVAAVLLMAFVITRGVT